MKLDIALCLEVFKSRPQSPADWEKVSTSLKNGEQDQSESTDGGAADSGSPAALPKARGCKDCKGLQS